MFDYGMGADSAQAAPEEDPDANLVPELVRRLVLPIAGHLIARQENKLVTEDLQQQVISPSMPSLSIFYAKMTST